MRTLACRLQAIVLPYVCVVCGSRAVHRDICEPCARALPWNVSCCGRCALPLPAAGTCGPCLAAPPRWDRARCPFVYEFPVRSLLQQFKFSRRLANGRVLSEAMAQWIGSAGDAGPDVLVPVPLHWRRRVARQFNQASEIAHIAGGVLGIPVRQACRRTRATPAQSGLDAAQRRRNLRGAFAVVREVRDLHVAIVDDVLTTGTTASELARTLRRAGAARVDVWALARA